MYPVRPPHTGKVVHAYLTQRLLGASKSSLFWPSLLSCVITQPGTRDYLLPNSFRLSQPSPTPFGEPPPQQANAVCTLSL